jgi:tetratricopeptide (TPR) repeat protein
MDYRFYLVLMIVTSGIVQPVLAGNGIALSDNVSPDENAWHDYNQAVDLANAGRYSEALVYNEKALAVSQNFPVAWANEAGILVQLGRYDDAIRAADTVINSNRSGIPNTFAASYYSKGDALRALGRMSEARDSYAKAYQLDPTLVSPDLSADIAVPSPAVTRLSSPPPVATSSAPTPAPLGLPVTAGAVLLAMICCRHSRFR